MTTPKPAPAPKTTPEQLTLEERERADVIAMTKAELEKIKAALPDTMIA